MFLFILLAVSPGTLKRPSAFDAYGGITLIRKAPSTHFRWEPIGCLPFLFTPKGSLYLGPVAVSTTPPPRGPYLLRLDLSRISGRATRGRAADIFSSRFQEALVQALRKLDRPAADPWCMGILLDSDLRGLLPDGGLDNLLSAYLALPDDSPGRIRAEELLHQEGDPDGTLNAREIAAFEALLLQEVQQQVRQALPKGRRSVPLFVLPPKAKGPDG